jgi:hypothetical protein
MSLERADAKRSKRTRRISLRGRQLNISGDPSAITIARAIKEARGGEPRIPDAR